MAFQVTLTRKDGSVRADLQLYQGRSPVPGEEFDVLVNGRVARARATVVNTLPPTSPGMAAETVDFVQAVEV